MIGPPPRSTLFPTTPLFRSQQPRQRAGHDAGQRHRDGQRREPVGVVEMLHGKGSLGRERRSEEHTSELQSRQYLVCRLLLEKKKESLVQYVNSRLSTSRCDT